MKYSLSSGGKRLRPSLLLAACEFAGGDVKNAIPYACAVEYIHTYSLIHDDLPSMDNDDFRRGLPTCHKVYGEAIAILTGDGLLTSAFEAMNKDMLLYLDSDLKLKRRVKASYEIAKGAGCRGMVAGQISDVEAENKQCSKEMLDYININKTAALIIASIRAGAHLGGANEKMLSDLTDYAEFLGLAFQIEDDILDIAEDEKNENIGSADDKINIKSTYPGCYGMEESKSKLIDLTNNAIAVLEPYYDEAEFFTILANDLFARIK
jgi:geranylgeranyl diphosphate synthase type II